MPRRLRSNPKTKHQAIQLRKKSTPAERKLWSQNRDDQLGVTFRRQHAVGNSIPDFCCPKVKLIIELDGSQHLEQIEYDNEGTKNLESLGYKEIRFRNNDVMHNTPALACWCKCGQRYSPYFMRWKKKPVMNEFHLRSERFHRLDWHEGKSWRKKHVKTTRSGNRFGRGQFIGEC